MILENVRNCIYIPSCDAKDLYLANNFIDESKNKIGYQLVTKQGKVNYNRFINSLDYSLDSEELRDIVKQVYTKKDMFTFTKNEKEYSNKIINVTFKYSCKEFNKVKKNTYVRFGYLVNELNFDDNIALNELNEIVGVITETKTKHLINIDLPGCFEYIENKTGDMIYKEKNIPVLKTKKQLREHLYDNGFTCEGIHYIRFKRTSGSSRVGKCLFIDERLYQKMHEWENCGLDIKEGDNIDLAAYEAYISLPTSSAIDTLHINPKSILLIPDYNSEFKESSIVVSMNDNKRIAVNEDKITVSNSIFDGQSLIDISIMGDYAKYGMVLLRNRFFKSCCFNTNLQKWFIDNNITEINQLHKDSFTLAEKIEDIKLITTPNSIKYLKFSTIENWLHNIDDIFSVVKHEKETHFFNGTLVQTHYQLLNTLQLTREEVSQLLNPSFKYVNLLNTDTDVFKYHVKCTKLDDVEVSNELKDKNEIIYTMMNISDNFYKTKYFYDFKHETCKSYLKNMKKGHILIDGNYSVLFGNPYEMLLQTIGLFDGTTSLPPSYVHTKRYSYGKKILGCRSPHISTSNLLVSTNMRHDLIDKYFNITNEIVCINSINENTLERLSGADFDSDAMIITDNEIIINAALRNYDVFKVPANHVPAKKVKRTYSNLQKADLDYNTSENKIGEIVNLSQELNTMMWHYINTVNIDIHTPNGYETIKDIYYDICVLNVLSCIEIDKAKKEFDISSVAEINKVKNKWLQKTFDNKTIKPAFLGFIAGTKGYRNPDKKKYNYHETSMDYLLHEINLYRSSKTDASCFIPLSECFRFEGFNENSVNWKQLKSIVSMCETTNSSINAIWNKDYYEPQEKYELSNRKREDLVFNIQSLKINKHTMYMLISYTDMKKYSHISKLLFYILFNYKNSVLTEIMQELYPSNSYIKQVRDGDIDIYGMKFKKYIEEKNI